MILFIRAAEKQPDKSELIEYIQKEICLCRACNNNCKKYFAEINGLRRKVARCHREISKYHKSSIMQSYTDYDIQMLKRMIDIRFEQITYLNH
jgi:hypothetical protein